MSEQLDTIETDKAAKPGLTKDRPLQATKTAEHAEVSKASHVPKSPNIPRPTRNVAVEEEDDESFFQRHRIALIAGAIVLMGGGWVAFHKPSGKSEPVRRAPEQQIARIQLPPPPPPPPPKVQPPPPKDEKQPEQAPLAAPEKKPEAAKPKPVDKPPEGLGTNIKGPGQGMAGLGGSGNGMLGGTGTGPGGGGSLSAWYAGQVQAKIAEAFRNNNKTRNASIKGLKFSVSVDATGRITGIRLVASTGDGALDDTIKNEVLTGIQLQEPPPGGKPMTITMILNARRPN